MQTDFCVTNSIFEGGLNRLSVEASCRQKQVSEDGLDNMKQRRITIKVVLQPPGYRDTFVEWKSPHHRRTRFFNRHGN